MARQLGQRQIPVLNRVGPALKRFEYTGIKQFESAVFVGEAAFSFGQFSELPMDSRYGMGCVGCLAQVVRVFEVSG